eukprot:GEMP01043921.1.p1 GENE.GEMP01043921.1~~GEMP01043921.1.p1  ORF type:complete len:315 (+),score=69.62 GEMP01043921.1:139-1083(+)
MALPSDVPLCLPVDAAKEVSSAPSLPSTPKEGYPLFLDTLKHASCAPVVQDVRQIINQMKQRTPQRPQAAKKLHAALGELCSKCLKCEAFKGEDDAVVWEHMEKFLLLKLTNELYAPPADRTEDERIAAWIQQIREANMHTPPRELGLHTDDVSMLLSALGKIDLYRSPKDKIVTLLNLQDMLYARIRNCDIVDALKSLFIEAQVERLCSNLEWIAYYRHPQRMTPEEHDCLENCRDTLKKIRVEGRAAARKLQRGSSSDDFVKELASCKFNYDQVQSLDELACSDVIGLLAEYQQLCRALRALEPDILELPPS